MSELLDRLQAYLSSRSTRERTIFVVGACVLALLVVESLVIGPLREQIETAQRQNEVAKTEIFQAARVAREINLLKGEVEKVESRIQPGEETNLFTLLESLAAQAGMKNKLESIKPKQPSDNADYPETRVEVSLKGATLEQTVKFLYEIENAQMHLIIRSLRIKAQGEGATQLDVSFSVSSFVRA